jgi:hypothetical protein
MSSQVSERGGQADNCVSQDGNRGSNDRRLISFFRAHLLTIGQWPSRDLGPEVFVQYATGSDARIAAARVGCQKRVMGRGRGKRQWSGA